MLIRHIASGCFMLLAGSFSAFGQASTTPQEILAKVGDTQKTLAKIEAEMRELSGRRDSEVYKLKVWSAANAEGRVIEWPMVVSKVEMGFFDARHAGEYRVWLRFDDGMTGEIDLEDELWGPVFEPLNDVAEFAQLRADPELETVVWPNGADFAPEFLYDRLKATLAGRDVAE